MLIPFLPHGLCAPEQQVAAEFVEFGGGRGGYRKMALTIVAAQNVSGGIGTCHQKKCCENAHHVSPVPFPTAQAEMGGIGAVRPVDLTKDDDRVLPRHPRNSRRPKA